MSDTSPLTNETNIQKRLDNLELTVSNILKKMGQGHDDTRRQDANTGNIEAKLIEFEKKLDCFMSIKKAESIVNINAHQITSDELDSIKESLKEMEYKILAIHCLSPVSNDELFDVLEMMRQSDINEFFYQGTKDRNKDEITQRLLAYMEKNMKEKQ